MPSCMPERAAARDIVQAYVVARHTDDGRVIQVAQAVVLEGTVRVARDIAHAASLLCV